MKDGKYLKASDKTRILNAFERFIKSGFKDSQFTKELYKHLSLHFGFITHYNQQGFYAERFESPSGRIETFKSICNAGPYNFRDENTSDCADLNLAILNLAKDYAEQIREQARTEYKTQLESQISHLQNELKSLK